MSIESRRKYLQYGILKGFTRTMLTSLTAPWLQWTFGLESYPLLFWFVNFPLDWTKLSKFAWKQTGLSKSPLAKRSFSNANFDDVFKLRGTLDPSWWPMPIVNPIKEAMRSHAAVREKDSQLEDLWLKQFRPAQTYSNTDGWPHLSRVSDSGICISNKFPGWCCSSRYPTLWSTRLDCRLQAKLWSQLSRLEHWIHHLLVCICRQVI